MLNGEDATLARIFIAKGGIVPRHSHRSEQFSLILSGALKFFFDDGETIVGAGEILLIPAHVPHKAEALEDTVDIDFFAPRREDWINKNDQLLAQRPQWGRIERMDFGLKGRVAIVAAASKGLGRAWRRSSRRKVARWRFARALRPTWSVRQKR